MRSAAEAQEQVENVIGRFELQWYVEPMKPTYFDFTVKDLDKAKTFFE